MNDENVLTQAEQWVLVLGEEEASSADRLAFERWYLVPGHAAAYAQAERAWRTVGRLAGRADIEQLTALALADTEPKRRVGRQRLAVGLAASLTVGVLTAAGFLAGRFYTPVNTYVTGTGQRSTVQLEDGSQFILNSATRLEVRFTGEQRQFVLKTGEAVFTVAEDPLRPFTVSAGDGEVTALGTRFQVRHEAQRVTVTLLEGRVAVDRPAIRQHLQLAPGDRVQFVSDAPDIARSIVDPDAASSWTQGRLRFRATPLGEMLDEVNRYTRTRIRLQDASLGRTPMYGVFDVGDAASVVQALQGMLPLEIARQDRHEIVLVRK